MSLMKLAPETVRLRRVAKAYALGEFSLSEYRQARREVIENFDAGRIGDDDTQPREQPLQREQIVQTAPRTPRSGRKWLVWLLAALTLIAATQLLAAETEQQLTGVSPSREAYIPAVSVRDPNPATSPRLQVEAIVFAESQDWLGETTTVAALRSVIDAKLEEIRLRNQPGTHGFTQAELAEVGRLLNALGAHGSDVALTAQDAADLSALLQDQKTRRGLSVVELEEIAAAAQDHLRDSGYFLAVAYVPSQKVTDGRVAIGLLPGVLGQVEVAGADERLAARFQDLVGRPVTTREINTRLYALNQAPGFSAQASFEPADVVGETRLNLNVLERSSVRGDLSLDNYGDQQTGKQRMVLGGDLINPAGRGDVLRVGLTAALDPSNQLLGFADYATPIGSRRQLRGRLARNDFNTGGVNDIEAEGWLLDGVLETYLYRDRLTGLSWELGIGHHSLDWQTSDGEVSQEVSLLSAALNARRVWDDVQIATDFKLYADVGSISGDTFAGQEDRFWDLGFNLFGWHPFDLSLLPGRQKASVQLRGQFSAMQLPSTRRLALGGIGAARGFERDIFLADQGLVLRGDLRTPLALGELALFLDAAYGKDRNELTPRWAHVANLGLSWDVMFGRHLQSSFSWAVPITAKASDGLDDDGAQFFWSLRYAH